MAVTDIAGEGGSVAVNNVIGIGEVEWDARIEVDQIPIPPMWGEKWEGAASGAGRITGSITGKLQYAGAGTIPWTTGAQSDAFSDFTGTVTLTATAGCTITGQVNFSNVAIKRSRTGESNITADFRNRNSSITVVWATS